MPTLPVPFRCLPIRSTRPSATPWTVTWLMNRSRHFVSESNVTTFTPACWAALRSAQTAFGSLAASTIAPACCCVAVWMKDDCAVGLASVGPTSWNLPLYSPTAVLPPASEAWKYLLPRLFGMKVTVLPLALPPPLPLLPLELLPLSEDDAQPVMRREDAARAATAPSQRLRTDVGDVTGMPFVR